MLIPVVCRSCGCQLAHLWRKYEELVLKYSGEPDGRKVKLLRPSENMLYEDTPQALALRELGLLREDRICCTRHFLTHVDLIDEIQ